MTAIREQIFAGIETALRTDTGAAEIERMPPGDPDQFDALHIIDDGQDPEEQTEAATSRFDMSFSIDGFVEGAGTVMHSRLNALHAKTVHAVMAFGDNSPLVEEIREGALRIARLDLGSKRRLAFSKDFFITIPTRRGEPDPA